MKHLKYMLAALVVAGFFALSPSASAQSMMNTQGAADSSSTAADEQKGQDVYNKLQNKQATCSQLTDDDFDVLGDFFMGRMMGDSHAAMNQYMQDRLGDSGEKQVHIAMGKRLSGCDVTASYPGAVSNYSSLSWMGGMMGSGSWSGMMGDLGHSSWSWVSVILGLLLVASVAWNVAMWWQQKQARLASRKK